MAVDNNFIRQYLANYWDNMGNLDGLSTNAKRIYSLIMDRRKKNDPKKPVNDYIYAELGVKPSGLLGEELTFLIKNHVTQCNTLKNYKSSAFFSKLNRLANKLESTPEQVLIDSGLGPYLERDEISVNFSNLNVYYGICTEIMKQILENSDQSVYMTIGYYYKTKGSFVGFNEAYPQIYRVLEDSLGYEFGGYYDDSLTNANAMLVNGRMYFKDASSSVPIVVNKTKLIQEILYAIVGFNPTAVLSPTLHYALRKHLALHKTLLNLIEVNPRVYAELKKVYLVSPQYTSLGDMLTKEGYFYPRLNTESLQYVPCQDKEHIVYVNDCNAKPILMDRVILAHVFENQMENDLLVKVHNDTYYVAVASKTGKKVEYPPFHMFYTRDIDTYYADDNYLNISSQNMRIPQQ